MGTAWGVKQGETTKPVTFAFEVLVAGRTSFERNIYKPL